MTRLLAIDPAAATGGTARLFDGVRDKLGLLPNMVRVMANLPG